jgi:probable rRNA maturation factor
VSESLPLGVDLCLQDNYFDPGNNPVAQETWHYWLETWLSYLSDYLPVAPSYELSLRLTDDREIQTYNSQYRHKDQPTDVLAFAALEVDFPTDESILESEPLYLGDIIISVETAQQQALRQNHPLSRELAWLTAHACLHLLGWDHPDETSLLEMLSLQETLLKTVRIVDT